MDVEVSRGSGSPPIPLTVVRARREYAPKQVLPTELKHPRRYRLRQARYVVLAQDIDRWAEDAAAAGRTLSVLDVGCGWGPLLCQLEAEPHFANLRVSGADVVDKVVHRRDLYGEFFVGDLTGGYPEIASDRYDVVVCEQVLEHLGTLDVAIATLARIVRPGGVLAIGVPIFFPPLHLARRHLVPLLAHLLPQVQVGTHEQAFSLWSFRRLLRAHPELSIARTRGFRIISGGLLRRLENYAWWWRFNRRLGELLPSLCIEVQILLVKSPVTG